MEDLNRQDVPYQNPNISSYNRLSDFFYKISRKKKKQVSDEELFAMTLVAHGGSAALSKAVSAPFDKVKLLLQLRSILPAFEQHGNMKCIKPRHMFNEIYKVQGLRSFWWGFGPHTLNVFQSTAIRLTAYQRCRFFFFPDAGREQSYSGFSLYWRKVQCFCTCTVATLLISYPLDVAYTRMAADTGLPWNTTKKTYKSFMHCIISNAINQGISSVYRGFSLCIAVSFPFICIAQALHDYFEYLILLNNCKKQHYKLDTFLHQGSNSESLSTNTEDKIKTYSTVLKSQNDFSKSSSSLHYPLSDSEMRAIAAAPLELFPWNLISGFFAGLVAQTITYPLDTIRRCYQYDGSCRWTSPPYNRRYKNISDCFKKCFRQGISNLYKGCGINMVKAIPECMVLSGLYYIIKTTLPL